MPAAPEPATFEVTWLCAFPPVLVTEPFVQISLIIALSLCIAAILFGVSDADVTADEATTFVPRNSSPMTAVSLGTIIGKCSLNSPVLQKRLLLAILSVGIFVVTPAVKAEVKIPIKVFTVVCASVSSV